MSDIGFQYLHGFLLFVLALLCLVAGFYTSKSTPTVVKFAFISAPVICLNFFREKMEHGYEAYPPDAWLLVGMIFLVGVVIYLVNVINVLKHEPPARWKIER